MMLREGHLDDRKVDVEVPPPKKSNDHGNLGGDHNVSARGSSHSPIHRSVLRLG
jgi:hypothetical protein